MTSITGALAGALQFLRFIFKMLLLDTPNHSWWTTALLWAARMITFSLIMRTYIVPFLLARMSNHIRIRSISLRSVRGLYIRRGALIWRVDRIRISYRWSSVEGHSRLSLKIEGLKLEVGKDDSRLSSLPFRGRRQNTLTLSDFAPSPVAHRIWLFISRIYSIFEPSLRPLVRTYVVSSLRLLIRFLPAITQALDFDLSSAIVTLTDSPETKIVVDEAKFHTSLAFTQLDNVPAERDPQITERPTRSFSVAAWQLHLKNSFRRAWDRAWEKIQGTVSISLKINDVTGLTADGPLTKTFLRLTGAIDLSASARFNPQRGSIETHGFAAKLNIGEIDVLVDAAHSIMDLLKMKLSDPTVFDVPLSPLTSPQTSLLSPMSPYTPFSASSLYSFAPSVTSPLSSRTIIPSVPTSPFLEVLSASMRPRRRKHPPVPKLKDFKNQSWLSLLMSAEIKISTIKLRSGLSHEETYEACIHQVQFSGNLSDATNFLHRQWLGRSSSAGDNLESDAYTLGFCMNSLVLDRTGGDATRDHSRLVTLGSIEIEALMSRWPSPLLVAPSFIRGDPNAPLLAVHVNVVEVSLTERLEFLQKLLAPVKPGQRPPQGGSSHVPSLRFPTPRLALDIQCGKISGRLISDLIDDESFAVELRTDGFSISALSHFLPHSFSMQRNRPSNNFSDDLSLQMDFQVSVVLKDTFVRVREVHNQNYRYSKLPASTLYLLDDPPLISFETVEIKGLGNAFGDAQDGGDIVHVDWTSAFVDVHCSVEAVGIELWHAKVITAVVKLLSVFSSTQNEITLHPSRPRLLDRLPVGCLATISFARFVLFVTAPDLNPNDDLDLSRGLAFRTGFSVQYCALDAGHTQRFRGLHIHSQTRHKLGLPEERIVLALAAAKSSPITHLSCAFLRLSMWDFSLRSAVATQYAMDDPNIVERDDPILVAKEHLRIRDAKVDIGLSGQLGPAFSNTRDSCQVTVDIPYVRGEFQLAHVYSTLLASRTFGRLLQPHTPQHTAAELPNRLSYRVEGNVKTIQIFFSLSEQKLAIRINSASSHSSPDGTTRIRWGSLLLWVVVPPHVNKWDDNTNERWEELGHFQEWDISLPRLGRETSSVSVKGDSGRLRIPFGYVLADLIQAIGIGVKSSRHLMRIVAAGRYTDMPAPEAEAAKLFPHLALRVRCLSLEASDDPFENKLNLVWRTGSQASKQRLHREEAFLLKIATILASDSSEFSSQPSVPDLERDYNFTPNYSVPIEDARQRLYQVHAADWNLTHRLLKEQQTRSEEMVLQWLRGASAMEAVARIPNIVPVLPVDCAPPLFRVMLNGLSLNATSPSFPLHTLPDFLHDRGNGLPRDTQFSLLIPMHLSFALSSLRVTLRDYPLPMVDIPPNKTPNISACEFDTDLVIAEEMGTALSVDWIDCGVVESNHGIQGAAPFSISIPKTIMPVKTYANPNIRVTTTGVTAFSWGMSYGAATQDLMRVADTLSNSPRDPSPGLGFWDKLRLVFHWTIRVSFKGDCRLHMKGSRDPYNVTGNGAGFALCWRGNPNLLIGHKNEDKELIQIISDSMLIAIPKFETTSTLTASSQAPYLARPERYPLQKICAKFRSGVHFGVGFILERSCGPECRECSGSAFHRKCRVFDFRSHYEIKLEKKNEQPVVKSPEDSYNGFRSDFIHLSISLSSVRNTRSGTHTPSPNSLHLTPKAFAHFWSFWSLFDSILSLPIRQGSYYPQRSLSPKFGRHLATLKYRLSVARLFITHVYIDDSRETWVDGVTSFVGVKGMIDEFHADMHQRDQETIVPGQITNSFKTLRNKPFYAAEVVFKGLDLRAMLATFVEPLKQSVPVTSPTERSDHGKRYNLLAVHPSSRWIDLDDFVETDWSPASPPTVHLLQVVVCPRITYFKRNSKAQKAHEQSTKFGSEETHICLLGKEASIVKVQVSLASDRVTELRRNLQRGRQGTNKPGPENGVDESDEQEKMIALLEDYIAHLRGADAKSDVEGQSSHSYHMASAKVSPHEWAEFDNVYHIHCPKVFLDGAIRDIMLQYYYCSRARRGLEYRMATRAVKFIRDQAKAALATDLNENRSRGPASSAQAAAQALRKILRGDSWVKSSAEESSETRSQVPGTVDPLNGWSGGISLWKNHFCLLLKPQIVLRSEGIPESVCVLAAVQAKLQSFAIMDDSNVEDPVSGKIMSRNYSSLTCLQAFSPAHSNLRGDGCVPFEVLIDFRCENSDFDRLVPQTDATFHYDKFNRLRLRNNVTSVGRTAPEQSTVNDNHLQNQTDLIQVHIPRFTVSASDQHFQAISNIVTNLVLFSDATHKTRSDKLETLLFTYDFTDLSSTADVVADLQGRLRTAQESVRTLEDKHSLVGDGPKLQILKLKAHIFLLAEELNFIFEAIKLAQDQMDDQADQKSAVLLHASSSEISWRMLDENRILLAKLAVRAIDFSWLSRQDSSTVNNLDIGDLQAFDGSPHAIWAEILCKHNEPSNHPLLKRGLFIVANWTVLAPVGGITILQEFDLNLHPMRLQIDARLGRRIMEYLWPARKTRNRDKIEADPDDPKRSQQRLRSSLDSPRALENLRQEPHLLAPPPLRTLGPSRSFTDIRSSAAETLHSPKPKPRRNLSSDTRRALTLTVEPAEDRLADEAGGKTPTRERQFGDAAEMKTRSSQKTFVLVRISSLNLLLSIMKEESFECRDALIKTRQLEYRNQTWSFEELVNQFIPSDLSWRGWVKMVFHQPLVPVLPVARELFSKTKLISWKGSHLESPPTLPKLPRSKAIEEKAPEEQGSRSRSPHRLWRKGTIISAPLGAEPVEQHSQNDRPSSRARMRSLFSRSSSRSRKSRETSFDMSASSSSHSIEGIPSRSSLSNDKPHD